MFESTYDQTFDILWRALLGYLASYSLNVKNDTGEK